MWYLTDIVFRRRYISVTDSYGGVTLLPRFFKTCNDLIRYLLQRSSQVVLPYTLCGSGYRRCRRRTPEPSSPFQVSELETSWPPRNSTREHSLLGHQSRFLVRSSSVTYRGTCYFASVEVTRHTVGGSPSVSGRSAPARSVDSFSPTCTVEDLNPCRESSPRQRVVMVAADTTLPFHGNDRLCRGHEVRLKRLHASNSRTTPSTWRSTRPWSPT